jgi:hypothetical protein
MTWILDRMQLLVRTALGRGAAPAEADTASADAAPNGSKFPDKAHSTWARLSFPASRRPFVLGWQRLFFKLSNFVFHVSRGLRYWLASMHVQLFIGISLLMLSRFPGLLEECHCWWEWSKSCASCQIVVKPMEGIFCANFCKSRGAWGPCRMTWHANCYKCLGIGQFPFCLHQDIEGNMWFKQRAKENEINQGVRGHMPPWCFNANGVGSSTWKAIYQSPIQMTCI